MRLMNLFPQYIKKMGAHDVLAASQRPPSAHQLKAGVTVNTESHVLLEVLGRLLTCGVNSVWNLNPSLLVPGDRVTDYESRLTFLLSLAALRLLSRKYLTPSKARCCPSPPGSRHISDDCSRPHGH